MEIYDAIIVGAGPAGAACAAIAAKAGLNVVLLERTFFPRHKVCGDCINPSCWPLLDHLGVATQLRRRPHGRLESVRFEAGDDAAVVEVPLPGPPRDEIALPRSELDMLLLTAATRAGATVRQGERVLQASRTGSVWAVDTDRTSYLGTFLVAADGRNSSICRLLRIAPPHRTDRLAVQTHAPLDPAYASKVALRLLPDGYCGVADIGDDRMNVCLVCAPRHLEGVRRWAEERFSLDPGRTAWHSIAPLQRKPIRPVPLPNLLLVGDAARVVEPFTGEGIYYGLQSGTLAGRAIAAAVHSPESAGPVLTRFARDHRNAYRRRLWINHLARLAVTHRRLGGSMIAAGVRFPALLPALTRRIVAAGA